MTNYPSRHTTTLTLLFTIIILSSLLSPTKAEEDNKMATNDKDNNNVNYVTHKVEHTEENYWTPERMASAIPMNINIPGPGPTQQDTNNVNNNFNDNYKGPAVCGPFNPNANVC